MPLSSNSVVVADADLAAGESLASGLRTLGYDARAVSGLDGIMAAIEADAPGFAVVDLRLADGNGIEGIAALVAARPGCSAIVLSGHGSLATAVAAVKAGAKDFLVKPASPEEVVACLTSRADGPPVLADIVIGPDEARHRHIQDVFAQCGGVISETARRLGMHRRTLQRILRRISDPSGRTEAIGVA